MFVSDNATTMTKRLTKAEEEIIQDLLVSDLASIYWDHDEFYEKSNNQSAQFFKKYQRSWPYYISNDFKWKETARQYITKIS